MLSPKPFIKMPGMLVCTCYPSSGETDTGGRLPRFLGSARLTCLVNSEPVRDPVSKERRWMTSEGPFRPPHACALAQTHTLPLSHTNTNTNCHLISLCSAFSTLVVRFYRNSPKCFESAVILLHPNYTSTDKGKPLTPGLACFVLCNKHF